MSCTIDDLSQSSCSRRRPSYATLPEAIILVLSPFAPLSSDRIGRHAPLLLLGPMLAPGAWTVPAALRAMRLAPERRFTNYHRVLNRAIWSARQGGRLLLGGALRYPWETVEVNWYGGQRKQLWVFSGIALWYTPGLPPSISAEPEFGPFPREAFALLLTGLPLAA